VVGGPVPALKSLNYLVSGNFISDNAHQEALYPIASEYNDYAVFARLSFLFPQDRGSISILAGDSREQQVLWSPFTEPGNAYKYLDNRLMLRTKQRFGTISLDFTPTLKTQASLQISMIQNNEVYGTRDYTWEAENGIEWYNDFRLKAEHLITSLRNNALPKIDLLIDSLAQYHDRPINRDSALHYIPYGIEGWFYASGDYSFWSARFLDQIQIKTSIMQWLGSINQVRAGVDYTTYDLEYYANESIFSTTSYYWDFYARTPHKFAAYISDQLNTKRINALLGIRYDYFQPSAFTYAYPWDFWNDSLITADPNTSISPRMGLRLLLLNDLAVSCKFTRRYYTADLHAYYTGTDTAVIRQSEIIFGNINMNLQNVTSFNLGFDARVFRDLFCGAAFYSQNIKGRLVRKWVISPISYMQYTTDGKSRVSGLEFYLKNRIFDIWTTGLNCVLQSTRSIEPDSGIWIYDDTNPWEDYHEGSYIQCYTQIDLPLDQYNILLRGISSSLYLTHRSGHPYIAMDLHGNIISDNDTLRMPGYWNVDWKFNKRISIMGTRLVLTCLINNLFNTEQVVDVYNTTGDPIDHGDPDPSVNQFMFIPVASSRYSPQADIDHDGLVTPPEGLADFIAGRDDFYNDPTNFKYPFQIRLGIGLEF
jgi:hypothetical protein